MVYLSTSKSRFGCNLYSKIVSAYANFGHPAASKFKKVIYLAWQPSTHLAYIGQTPKGIANRSRGHLESLSKIQDGRFNSCKMYNNPRVSHKYIFTEIVM